MNNTQSSFPGLPKSVRDVIDNAVFTEFATLTARGEPLDTPLFCFRADRSATIDVTTGLAYPVKAERARKRPKVGLLIEGGPGKPVVSIAAIAAVRDADLQDNAERYLAEVIAYLDYFSGGTAWSRTREAVWYWSRIFIHNTPVRICWWPNAESLEQAPQCWDAPTNTVYMQSDSPPARAEKTAEPWPATDWLIRAEKVADQGIRGHLTLVNTDGFPLPFPAGKVTKVDDGFLLSVPAGAPWDIAGRASLCFDGRATFVGEVTTDGDRVHFHADRLLPDLPLVQDPGEIWQPRPETYRKLMNRLTTEAKRRGQPLPHIPLAPPSPTEGGQKRAALMASMAESAEASGR